MKMKFCVFTTDGESREDGNVYYSRHRLVTTDNPNLTFSEPIFNDDYDVINKPFENIIEEIRSFGYDVSEPDVSIITIDGGCEE